MSAGDAEVPPAISNSSTYVVSKILHHIKSVGVEYVILEFGDGIVEDPGADPLLVGVVRRDLEDSPLYVHCAIWRDTLWRIVDNDAIAIIAAMAGVDLPSDDLPARIKELELIAEQLTERVAE
jgi:hypothetical protein